MSTFTQYLTEAAKSYDYKVKVAGMIADDFKNRMETALQKFELAKLSAGKKTPIQSLPLDFPALRCDYNLSSVSKRIERIPSRLHERKCFIDRC